MSREMRRKDRRISAEDCISLLRQAEYGVLATVDVDGQPYGVPLSYVFHDGKIYFHCAREGFKLENLQANARCSFTVVGRTQPVYENSFSTYYESVIVFGNAKTVTEEQEKGTALMELARKYLPANMDRASHDIQASFAKTTVCAITIASMSGKAKRPK